MRTSIKLEPEQELVVRSFESAFTPYKDRDFILYGIGKNTKAILDNVQEFHIIGLMDSKTVGETIYGLPVLKESEVSRLKPIVVIIARDSLVTIIYRRIEKLYLEHKIPIYNFRGEQLGIGFNEFDNRRLPYWKHTQKELEKEIECHTVISFDIFDTLIMRKVLEPDDIFILVEKQLAREGMIIPFQKMRIKAEKVCDGIPDISAIYHKIKELYSISQNTLKRCREIEYQMEQKCLIARDKMIEIFEYAKAKGKKVYLVSDMYYPTSMMIPILNSLGIHGYKELLISCEKQKEKKDGTLFDELIVKAGTSSILHIGDNRRDDIDEAKKKGIDAFLVYSAYELLMASSMQGLAVNLDEPEKRAIMGLILCRYFNNPFILNDRKGIVGVDEMKQLGECFIAPMLIEFLQWLVQKEEVNDLELMLFPARDGFLLYKLYEIFAKIRQLPKGIYMKASRRAVSVASIKTKEDILSILKRPFLGTIKELLGERFGIETESVPDQYASQYEYEQLAKMVLMYQQKILENAAKERKRYLEYLFRFNIYNIQRIGIFDFVAGGSIQYYLSKLLNKKLNGFYFATLKFPNWMFPEGKDIDTAYGNVQTYGSCSSMAKHYLILECILTDPNSTFIRIEESGKFSYQNGENKKYQKMKKVHNAVIEYAREYVELYGKDRNWKPQLIFSDEIFGFLFCASIYISPCIKEYFVNDDSYDGTKEQDIWV